MRLSNDADARRRHLNILDFVCRNICKVRRQFAKISVNRDLNRLLLLCIEII